MKKLMIIKTMLTVMASAGIIIATSINVKCDENLQYFGSSEEADAFILQQYENAGYSHGDVTDGSNTKQATESPKKQDNQETPKEQKVAKACAHVYKDTIVKEPTCAEDGEMESKCTKCGEVFKTVISATGKHDYASEVTKEPTCIETGIMTYTCKVCGDTYTEEIPVIDHKYEETVTKEATCSEAGEKTFTCTMCGESYTEEIPATGHQEAEPFITKKAGIFTKGEEVVKCSVCGEVLATSEIPSKYPVSYLYIIIALAGVLAVAAGVLLRKRMIKKGELAKSA